MSIVNDDETPTITLPCRCTATLTAWKRPSGASVRNIDPHPDCTRHVGGGLLFGDEDHYDD